MRLQKYMSRAGVASRRRSEKMILAGEVSVNGRTVTEPGTLVDISDVVRVRGSVVEFENTVYYLLHKPKGYVSTAQDEFGRNTVTSLVPGKPRVYPVGRLDADTTGLMLLTNDGNLAYALMHPKYEVPRVYLVRVYNEVLHSTVDRLLKGIELDDGLAKYDSVRLLTKGPTSLMRVRLHVGRNRIVRRTFEAVGHRVVSLHRESMGLLRLDDLARGSYRSLSTDEVKDLYDSVGMRF